MRLKFEGQHQRPSLIELVSVFCMKECSRFARHVVVRNILESVCRKTKNSSNREVAAPRAAMVKASVQPTSRQPCWDPQLAKC